MPVITFWTEIGKEIGQTASAIAVATQMAMEHNSKILLLTTYNHNELKGAFWKKSEEMKRQGLFNSLKQQGQVGINNGMAGIMMAMSSNKLMPDQITNYTKTVFKGRLEVLAGAEIEEVEYRKNVLPCYLDLIRKAKQYYDYVILDLNKEYSEIVDEILKESDIIVYGINQKNGNMEIYMKSLAEGFLKGKSNVISYIGRYDRFSKYSTKNITRTLKLKKMNVVPYNTLFAESCDEGLAAEYFMKMTTVTGPDRNVDFINDVRDLVNAILYKEQELKMNYGRN